MLSNASFARLLDFLGVEEQSAIGVCFRDKECFERDRPLLYVCVTIMAQEISSALLEDDSEWIAHEDSKRCCGQVVVVELFWR